MKPRIVIVESGISTSIGGPISIDQIEISQISMPGVEMNNFHGINFTYSSCKAKNVQFFMKLAVNSTTNGSVDLPWPLDRHDVTNAKVNYSTFSEDHALGDIDIEAGSFSFKSPTMTVGSLSMKADPIGDGKGQGITVNEMKVKDISMKCTEVPLESPLGLNFDSSFPLQNPMKPNDVMIEETSMAKMDSNKITSPSVTMRDIKALNITIPSVMTEQIVILIKPNIPIALSTNKKTYGAGVTRSGDPEDHDVTLDIKIDLIIEEIKMTVEGLEFKDVKGTVETESANSKGFDMDLVIKGIKIKGLNLCGMKIPEIMVEI